MELSEHVTVDWEEKISWLFSPTTRPAVNKSLFTVQKIEKKLKKFSLLTEGMEKLSLFCFSLC